MNKNMTWTILHKLFVAWSCNGCSTAPLTDYINIPVCQELIDEHYYNGVRNDERVYLDLRNKVNLSIQLKKSATKKLSLRVCAYSCFQDKDLLYVIKHIA